MAELNDMACLNLERRPDRRLQAWQQFRRESLAVKRIESPDSLLISESRGYRNVGARACGAAHRLAWRQARRVGRDRTIVFEDDVLLCRGFGRRLADLWSSVPDDWMVLYFGCVFRTRPDFIADGLLKVTGPIWDMHGYAIRKPLWEKVSRDLGGMACRSRLDASHGDSSSEALSDNQWLTAERRRGRRRFDSACDNVLGDYHADFPAYAVWPPMAWQVNGLSNNENSVRGNYLPDGTQSVFRHAIQHLPGVGKSPEAVSEIHNYG